MSRSRCLSMGWVGLWSLTRKPEGFLFLTPLRSWLDMCLVVGTHPLCPLPFLGCNMDGMELHTHTRTLS